VPSALESTTLPLLFSSLPDDAPKQKENSKRDRIWQTLRALDQLCVSPPLFETLVIRLLAKFDVVCGVRYQEGSVTVGSFPEDRDERAAYCHAMLFTLGNVMEKKMEAGDPDVGKYVKELVERLYNVVIVSSLKENSQTCVTTHIRLLQSCGRLGRIITQALTGS
jgi:DNA repair/transcription protein MET18/MMS19